MRVLAILAVLVCVSCGVRVATPKLPTVQHLPVVEAPALKPGSVQAKEAELNAAKGEVSRLEGEVKTLRLAPLRAALLWVEGISLLGMLAGIGLAVAALFWGLGFTWKIPAGVALAFGAILLCALGAGWALDYIAWFIGALGVLGALGLIWLAERHLSLAKAAKVAWDHIPDEVVLAPKVERCLARLR